MGAKMANMEVAMAAAQAPCHEAYQPMQAESIDCCGSQAMCKTACPTAALLSSVISIVGLPKQANPPAVFVALFQSAEASAGFKPPIA